MTLDVSRERLQDLCVAIFHATLCVKCASAEASTTDLFIQSLIQALHDKNLASELLPAVDGKADLLVNDSVVVRWLRPDRPSSEQEVDFRANLQALGKRCGILVDYNRKPLVDGIMVVDATRG